MEIQHYQRHQKILVAVDCIIFGFDGAQLKVLLIKRGFQPEKGKWSLMGGFVSKNENADEAAARVLSDLTGISDVYMEQLYTFTAPDRDSAGRVISIAYFALINISDYDESVQGTHEAKWFPIQRLPRLIFDHRDMVTKARDLLRIRITNEPVVYKLLPAKFTLQQLQRLHEAVYGHALDPRNFTKRILSLGILKRLGEKDKSASKKGAFLFELKPPGK